MCRSASSSTSPRPEMPEDAGVGSGGDAIVHELHSMPPRPGSPGAWVAATDPGGDTIVHKLPTDRVMAAGRWSGAGTGHTHPRRTLGHMSRCAIKDDGTLRSCGTGKGEARSHPFLLHLRTSPAERGNLAGKAPGRKAGRPMSIRGGPDRMKGIGTGWTFFSATGRSRPMITCRGEGIRVHGMGIVVAAP